jgi:hypothetical protein
VVLFKDWFVETMNHRDQSILISDIAQSTTVLIKNIDLDVLATFSQGQGIRQITATVSNLRVTSLFEILSESRIRFAESLGGAIDLTREQYEALHDGEEVPNLAYVPKREFRIARVGKSYESSFQDLGVEYYEYVA